MSTLKKLAKSFEQDVEEKDFEKVDFDGTQAKTTDYDPDLDIEDAEKGFEGKEFTNNLNLRADIDFSDDDGTYEGKVISTKAWAGLHSDSEEGESGDEDDYLVDDESDNLPEVEYATDSEDMDDDDDDDDVDGELAALHMEDMTLIKTAERSENELEKAKRATNQSNAWKEALEDRIALQPLVTSINRLPEDMESLLEDDRVQNRYAGSVSALRELCRDFADLRTDIIKENVNIDGSEDLHIIFEETENLDSETLWKQYMDQQNVLSPFCEDLLNEAQRKVNASSGIGARGYKAFGQKFTSQVSAVLEDESRLLKRTQQQRFAANILGKEETPEDEEEELNAEIFDDNDFFTTLMNEVLDSVAPDELLNLKKQKKKTKRVDTKASKGRRLRFTVHPKLVNFMAPEPLPECAIDAEELFKSLFQR